MRISGIDEAGYGPTLGPLTIAAVLVEAEHLPALICTFAQGDTGVADSKSIHKAGNIAPLERVALPALVWLCGHPIRTAADLFAQFGEHECDRTPYPWLAGAAELSLPLKCGQTNAWNIESVTPIGFRGALVQPAAYNSTIRSGNNKAQLEMEHIGSLLSWLGNETHAHHTTVDRLGGRRYYRDFLAHVWPDAMPLCEEETAALSRYRVCRAGWDHVVSFCVGGESVSPLTAIASCIAKYAREVHMELFNRHWCTVVPGLKPTAGYPEDARRWLEQVGNERIGNLAASLVRCS